MAAPRKYPSELRERAVRMVQESGRPIAHVARDLGIHKEALRHWVRQVEADAAPRASCVLPSEVQEELTRLRKGNAELHRARDLEGRERLFRSGARPDPATVTRLSRSGGVPSGSSPSAAYWGCR